MLGNGIKIRNSACKKWIVWPIVRKNLNESYLLRKMVIKNKKRKEIFFKINRLLLKTVLIIIFIHFNRTIIIMIAMIMMIFQPLAIFIHSSDCNIHVVANIVLCFFFWLPAVLHALWYCFFRG